MIHENKIFKLEYSGERLPDGFYELLDTQLLYIANQFGFEYLPHEYKIHISLLEKEAFIKEKNKYLAHDISFDCVAFSTYKVYVISYSAVSNQYSIEDYFRLIMHECIHVLQFYATKIPYKSAIWLYEAIASYLSGQSHAEKKISLPDWNQLLNDFYRCNNCYNAAYEIGKCLFRKYPISQVMDICSDISKAEEICRNEYFKLLKF